MILLQVFVRERQVNLALGNVSPPASLGAASHTTTISDDDTVSVAFTSSSDATVEAGGVHTELVRLTLTGTAGAAALAVEITADVTDAGGGSATSGTDYSAIGTQTLTFAIGSANGATQDATLTVLDDSPIEGDETVNLALGNVCPPASLGATSHTTTITDDDTASVAFTSSTDATVEAGGVHTELVRLTLTGTAGAATLAVEITADVTDAGGGSATSGSDYATFGTQTVTFAIGSADGATQGATLTVFDDSLIEGDETVNLALGNVSPPASLGAASHTTTIRAVRVARAV